MSIEGPEVRKGFNGVKAEENITRFSRGNSPIARAYEGITQEDGKHVAHLRVNDVVYAFDVDAIRINDDGAFVVDALTSQGSELITLSEEAVRYIEARRSGEGYDEIMTLSGHPDGHYGHRPYELD